MGDSDETNFPRPDDDFNTFKVAIRTRTPKTRPLPFPFPRLRLHFPMLRMRDAAAQHGTLPRRLFFLCQCKVGRLPVPSKLQPKNGSRWTCRRAARISLYELGQGMPCRVPCGQRTDPGTPAVASLRSARCAPGAGASERPVFASVRVSGCR